MYILRTFSTAAPGQLRLLEESFLGDNKCTRLTFLLRKLSISPCGYRCHHITLRQAVTRASMHSCYRNLHAPLDEDPPLRSSHMHASNTWGSRAVVPALARCAAASCETKRRRNGLRCWYGKYLAMRRTRSPRSWFAGVQRLRLGQRAGRHVRWRSRNIRYTRKKRTLLTTMSQDSDGREVPIPIRDSGRPS